LNNNENQIFKFYGKQLTNKIKDTSARYIDNSYSEFLTRKSNQISDKEFLKLVFNYFSFSGFKENLVLDLITTCDNFSQYFERFKIDFESNNVEILNSNAEINNLEENTLLEDKNYLKLKVRRDELIDVISNRKPWEDLSIGFQCRVYRNPNIYNSRFWFYFTNVYISSNVPRVD
jgi:CMP-N-acetylneuraminate monooxygenase